MTYSKPVQGWKLKRTTTHPGEMLSEEFLKPMGLSANQLALTLRVPANRITEIINGKRGITADTAYRLSAAFGNSPEFWLNLQQSYDLSRVDAEEIRKQVGSLDLAKSMPERSFSRSTGKRRA